MEGSSPPQGCELFSSLMVQIVTLSSHQVHHLRCHRLHPPLLLLILFQITPSLPLPSLLSPSSYLLPCQTFPVRALKLSTTRTNNKGKEESKAKGEDDGAPPSSPSIRDTRKTDSTAHAECRSPRSREYCNSCETSSALLLHARMAGPQNESLEVQAAPIVTWPADLRRSP